MENIGLFSNKIVVQFDHQKNQ